MGEIEINAQFEQVLKFVNQTNQLLFLTGKAGTGKTTLLKYIRNHCYKQMAVVAPTGVAAINAGGSTIHSFFQFPFSPFLPAVKLNGELETSSNQLPTLKYNSQRLAIFKNLELLIIDEISMVRADLLDQIDYSLRYTRKKTHLPFGGVQVVFIGDMHQLPPVVPPEEWKLLQAAYKSPYFFESFVIRNYPPVYIELTKIYRQHENTFIDLLNQVRHNRLTKEGLTLLNSFYKPHLSDEDYQQNITLTTHNRKADEINSRNLEALPTKSFTYKAATEGLFSEKNYPAELNLVLKKNTRVMFLKNNIEKNYYNGKIGWISYLDDSKIKVKCEEDQTEIEVEREKWTNVSYQVDTTTKHINEEVLGSFEQFPLRLAWAITIHKSQGLTFDKLIIDAAESFSAGQVYVALSRCRSLKGLILSSCIQEQSLMNDKHILDFSNTRHNEEQIQQAFSDSQKIYLKNQLINLFDFSEANNLCRDLTATILLFKKRVNSEGLTWFENFRNSIETISAVSLKFKNQLLQLFELHAEPEKNQELQERIKKGALYFETEIQKITGSIETCTLVTESKEAATDLNVILQNTFDILYQKQALTQSCKNGFAFLEFIQHKLNIKYPQFKINVYASSKNLKLSAEILHPHLYRKLMMLRDTICNDEQVPVYLVANSKSLTELCNFLPQTQDELLHISGFGKARAEAYGQQFLNLIKEFMIEHNLSSNMEAKLKTAKKKSTKKTSGSNQITDDETSIKKIPSKTQSFEMFQQGLSTDEIARKRGFSKSTIEGHLVPFVALGKIQINNLVDTNKQNLIRKALENYKPENGLNPIKSHLPSDISFSDIKFVLAHKLMTVEND